MQKSKTFECADEKLDNVYIYREDLSGTVTNRHPVKLQIIWNIMLRNFSLHDVSKLLSMYFCCTSCDQL